MRSVTNIGAAGYGYDSADATTTRLGSGVMESSDGFSEDLGLEATRFTGYFRDAETTLDYAKNRYHQPGMGRFMTVDSGRARPGSPGSWNRYAYTRGDPVNRVDRRGLDDCSADKSDDDGDNDCDDDDGDIGGSGVTFYDDVYASTQYEYFVTIFDPVSTVGQNGGGGGGGTTFAAAKSAFQGDAKTIANKKNFKTPCNNDFAALGTSAAAVQADAANLDIENGAGSTSLQASLYANTAVAGNAATQFGNQTIGQFFSTNPGVAAEAQLNGNTIYINPSMINLNNYYQNLATVLHEILHNVTGLSDDAIQTALGLSTSQVSNNITQKLLKDCF
jgi:RHS repeat-associated protein